jgi:hypothetical protein
MKEVGVFPSTQKIYILSVSEIHFTQQNYVSIPKYYVTYATDHPNGRAHAVSAIIIRQDIKHHELAEYETDYIQATNINWDGNFMKYINKVSCILKILLFIYCIMYPVL